jgi:hypothetical protein
VHSGRRYQPLHGNANVCVCVEWVPLRSWIDSTKSPASCAGNVNEPRFFLISNFCRVLNVVFFLLGDSSASEFSVQTFRNILSHLRHRSGGCAKSCARSSVCLCSQSGGGATIFRLCSSCNHVTEVGGP